MIFLVLLFLNIFLSLCQKCISDVGTPVDWWLILKTPKNVRKVQYLYFDSTMIVKKFRLIEDVVDSSLSPLGRTLNQINTLRMSTIAWNDQKPNGGVSTTFAHSKGLIAESQILLQGFFLQHSIPKFPIFNDYKINISINDSQNIYGQHIFCISLPTVYLQLLAEALLKTRSYIYHVDCNIDSQFKYLNMMCNSRYILSSQKFSFVQFNIGNFHFKNIFKNAGIQSDIFQQIGTFFNKSLLTQTWGRPHSPNNCKDPQIINVKQITFDQNVNWKTTADHSKWVISITGELCCFGGLNRMKSQNKRGGYFLCIDNANYIHQALLDIVVYDVCPLSQQL